ncbi:uncharacterized protein JCM6883_005422 [Sporobolomyces salmoneus]|uniref:uncharacterized protein n=1 Tax=Sporobolomyces salmoneus TaxID=183962 RepID=UPI00316FE124
MDPYNIYGGGYHYPSGQPNPTYPPNPGYQTQQQPQSFAPPQQSYQTGLQTHGIYGHPHSVPSNPYQNARPDSRFANAAPEPELEALQREEQAAREQWDLNKRKLHLTYDFLETQLNEHDRNKLEQERERLDKQVQSAEKVWMAASKKVRDALRIQQSRGSLSSTQSSDPIVELREKIETLNELRTSVAKEHGSNLKKNKEYNAITAKLGRAQKKLAALMSAEDMELAEEQESDDRRVVDHRTTTYSHPDTAVIAPEHRMDQQSAFVAHSRRKPAQGLLATSAFPSGHGFPAASTANLLLHPALHHEVPRGTSHYDSRYGGSFAPPANDRYQTTGYTQPTAALTAPSHQYDQHSPFAAQARQLHTLQPSGDVLPDPASTLPHTSRSPLRARKAAHQTTPTPSPRQQRTKILAPNATPDEAQEYRRYIRSVQVERRQIKQKEDPKKYNQLNHSVTYATNLLKRWESQHGDLPEES